MPSPFLWSAKMETVWQEHVVRPVSCDPRTDYTTDDRFGYPITEVRKRVLQDGRADFRKGHTAPGRPTLSADEKVLLYCFVNCKKHFYSAAATFETHHAVLSELMACGSPLVVDFGCGPGTAGLALAHAFPVAVFEYIGVDISPAMTAKAAELWGAAQSAGLVHAESRATYTPTWGADRINAGDPVRPVLLLFSYFCASPFLSVPMVRSLAEYAGSLATGRRPVAVVYTNSKDPRAGRSFEEFKTFLGIDPSARTPTETTIQYLRKAGGDPSDETFVHELLRLPSR